MILLKQLLQNKFLGEEGGVIFPDKNMTRLEGALFPGDYAYQVLRETLENAMVTLLRKITPLKIRE